MLEAYPVLNVQDDWVLEPEEMGSKRKFWFRNPENEKETHWLFKYPRASTGEHWAEKVAAEVARRLRIPHGRVELAVFQGERGVATESFARGGRSLIHGNQLLAGTVWGYDPEVRFRQSRHTLGNIWRALDSIFEEPNAARRAKLQFAEYLVLDALIGNTDRHHENWGLLWRMRGDRWRGFLAPSFDHASSLGRELLDADRERRLSEDRVSEYAARGRGGIYWSEEDRHAPSPLQLVRQAMGDHSGFLSPVLASLGDLEESSLSATIERVPTGWISCSARRFSMALLCHNLGELQEIMS